MKYTPGPETAQKDIESVLYNTLKPVAEGLGMAVIELSVFRSKGRAGLPGNVQVKVTIYREGIMGTNDCSRFHRAILPRLDLVFPGADISLEVSSPGIGRLIKDGNEMVHFLGRGIKIYRTGNANGSEGDDGSKGDTGFAGNDGWISGVLAAADDKGVTLETAEGKLDLSYEKIAKAKLDDSI